MRLDAQAGNANYVGKESNFLDNALAGLLHNADEPMTMYLVRQRDRWTWTAEVVPHLKNIPTAQLMAAMKRDRSTSKRWKTGKVVPHPKERERLEKLVRRSSVTGPSVS